MNEALRPKFLDLKEGAIVISLKPFVSSINARVTERNVSFVFLGPPDLTPDLSFLVPRSMILAQSSMSPNIHIIPAVYHGGIMGGCIIYTVSIATATPPSVSDLKRRERCPGGAQDSGSEL